MSQFAYEARNDAGEIVSGLVSAPSVGQAGRLLAERSLFVVRLAEDEDTPQRVGRSRGLRGASREQVAWLITQLSVMLETGMLLSDSLECLTRQVSDPRLRRVLEGLTRSVMEGQPLSQAMAEYPRTFQPSLVSLIRASELSGTMGPVMRRSAEYLLAEHRAVKNAKGALLYPAFMMLLCVAVTIFLLAVILPRFAEVFASREATLPLPTRMLMAMSDAFLQHIYALGVGTAGLVVGGAYLWRTAWGRHTRDTLLLKLPVLGKVFKALYLSRMFRTLEMLTNAGVPLTDTVVILRDSVPNTHYQRMWEDVGERIVQGESIADPLLESPLVPEQVGQMVSCGDVSGKLGVVSGRLADHLENEYAESVKTATQFIEPCMILAMGLFIGVIAASLMLPLFKSSSLVAG